MSKIIAVDGGTTNTRFTVIENGKILGTQRLTAGIRNTFSEDARRDFLSSVSAAIASIQGGIGANAEAIVLSGMIGSETGLYTLPHITAPISAEELAENIAAVSISEASELPMYFIPGVKTCPSGETLSIEELSEADIMRGEETELVGLFNKLGISGEATFILPGSHMKYIKSKNSGIHSFSTSIAGELLRAAAENTILTASLSGVFPKSPEKSSLAAGYRYAKAHGVTEAMFKVRILDKFAGYTKENLYSFLLGAVLHDDIKSLSRVNTPIYIGGSGLFREAIKALCELEYSEKEIFAVAEELAENAAAYGAEWLYNKALRK